MFTHECALNIEELQRQVLKVGIFKMQIEFKNTFQQGR